MIGNYVIKKGRFLSDVVMAFLFQVGRSSAQTTSTCSFNHANEYRTVVRTGKIQENAQNLIEASKLIPYIKYIFYIIV